MSVKSMSWAWDMPVTPIQKLILLALADFSNDDGVVWHGLKKASLRTNLAVSSIRKHLAFLILNGIVFKTTSKDENGRDLHSDYRLNLEFDSVQFLMGGVRAADTGVRAKKVFSFSSSPPLLLPSAPSPLISSPSSHTFSKKAIYAREGPIIEQIHIDLARDLDLDVQFEYDSFLDYCLAHNKKYKNYSAAFRNWLRKAKEFKQQGRKLDVTARQSTATGHWRACTEGLRKKVF